MIPFHAAVSFGDGHFLSVAASNVIAETAAAAAGGLTDVQARLKASTDGDGRRRSRRINTVGN